MGSTPFIVACSKVQKSSIKEKKKKKEKKEKRKNHNTCHLIWWKITLIAVCCPTRVPPN
jgi:hypothetical protein